MPVGPAQSAQSAQLANASSPHLGPELATLAQRSPPFIKLVVLLVQCALVRAFRGTVRNTGPARGAQLAQWGAQITTTQISATNGGR